MHNIVPSLFFIFSFFIFLGGDYYTLTFRGEQIKEKYVVP